MAQYFPWRCGLVASGPWNWGYRYLTCNSVMRQWCFGPEGDKWPMKSREKGSNWLNVTCKHEDSWIQGWATWPFFPTERFVYKDCSQTKVASGKISAHIVSISSTGPSGMLYPTSSGPIFVTAPSAFSIFFPSPSGNVSLGPSSMRDTAWDPQSFPDRRWPSHHQSWDPSDPCFKSPVFPCLLGDLTHPQIARPLNDNSQFLFSLDWCTWNRRCQVCSIWFLK